MTKLPNIKKAVKISYHTPKYNLDVYSIFGNSWNFQF